LRSEGKGMGLSYRDLIAWQKAMDLVEEAYKTTRDFPKGEIYGLTSQLRRAAVSVPSNIAEGQGRLTPGEFRQFLGHARGSLLETETQILLAGRLHYISSEGTNHLLGLSGEVGKDSKRLDRLSLSRRYWQLTTGN
jgi:four helix bundle protein